MPLTAPAYHEVKKFMAPIKNSRIIQKSAWLFEMELPLRDDMVPGPVQIMEYNGRFTIKIHMLMKNFPSGYLAVQSFKQRALDGMVSLDEHAFKSWLSNFDGGNNSSSVLTPHPATGQFHFDTYSGPVTIPSSPIPVNEAVLEKHPEQAPVKPYYGVVLPSDIVMELSHMPAPQAISSSNISDNSTSGEPVVVGGSSQEATIEVYSKDEMLKWPYKRLGNRRSRLIKIQSKAKRSGRQHQVELISQQLSLIDRCQQINKFGRFADKKTISREASEEARDKGVMPPLRRPRPRSSHHSRDYSPRRVSTLLPPVLPPRRSLTVIPPKLPPKLAAFLKSSSDSIDLFADIPQRDLSPVQFAHFKINKNINAKTKSKSKTKNIKKVSSRKKSDKTILQTCNNNVSALKQSSISDFVAPISKSHNIIKSRPVTRSASHCLLDSTVSDIARDTESILDWSDASPVFDQGSPNDPKVYLGGKFSDQTSPDSPGTQLRINSKALWYEPCTRREYAYKYRAWKAEGKSGRPTNSPLRFQIPPSRSCGINTASSMPVIDFYGYDGSVSE